MKRLFCMITLLVVLLWIGFTIGAAFAAPGHEHHSAAGRFYQSWMMPDAPHAACCNDQDCAPAASKFDPATGQWFARWTDDEDWVQVPTHKVDQNRETPDGRAHMCGRRAMSGDFHVFCFVRGGGV